MVASVLPNVRIIGSLSLLRPLRWASSFPMYRLASGGLSCQTFPSRLSTTGRRLSPHTVHTPGGDQPRITRLGTSRGKAAK